MSILFSVLRNAARGGHDCRNHPVGIINGAVVVVVGSGLVPILARDGRIRIGGADHLFRFISFAAHRA